MSIIEPSLGLALKLSPDVAESLRSHQPGNGSSSFNVTTTANLETIHSTREKGHPNAYHDKDDENYAERDTEEDWNEVLQATVESDDESDAIEEVHDPERHISNDADDSSEISMSEPSTLPLLAVNLEKLCGYIPSSKEEAQELRMQVDHALHDDDEQDAGEGSNESALSRHFDERSSEMFDTGIAMHADTKSQTEICGQTLKFVAVSYPEFLCRSDTQEVVSTGREWKRILHPHHVPVVQRLLQHLQNCNRSLCFKIDMNNNIRRLVLDLEKELTEKKQEDDLHNWRTVQRPRQLDKLYQVRETFEFKLETSREKLYEVEREQEAWILENLRSESTGVAGVEGLDFDPLTIYAHGGELDESPSNHHDSGTDDGYEDDVESTLSFSDDESSDLPINGSGQSNLLDSKEGATPLEGTTDVAQRKKKRRQLKLRQMRETQETAAQEALQRAKILEAEAEYAKMTAACPFTPKVKMAEATVEQLESRLKQVDDLLESLQEEEWADEEEGIRQENASEALQRELSSNEQGKQMSLLDQILAMIFGNMSPGERSQEDHYKFLHQEHQSIVTGWKEHFGELPQMITRDGEKDRESPIENLDRFPKERQQRQMKKEIEINNPGVLEQRTAIGLADVDGDWDDVDFHDLPELNELSDHRGLQHDSKSTTSGLRPGGRLSKKT